MSNERNLYGYEVAGEELVRSPDFLRRLFAVPPVTRVRLFIGKRVVEKARRELPPAIDPEWYAAP